MSGGPPLWSRLKYLNNHRRECHETLHLNSCCRDDEESFSSSATSRLAFAVFSEISQKLLDGFPRNLVQTFMFPSVSTVLCWLQTSSISLRSDCTIKGKDTRANRFASDGGIPGDVGLTSNTIKGRGRKITRLQRQTKTKCSFARHHVNSWEKVQVAYLHNIC